MKPKNLDKYTYDDVGCEEAEFSANRFNLIFSGALIILDLIVFLLSIFGVFNLSLAVIIPVCIVAFFLFFSPIVVFLIHDKLLKSELSILKWKEFKYVIYIPVYFGLLFVDIMLSWHAVLLIVIPPLMASQYRFIKRDWMLIFITTVVTIPIVIYAGFIFGAADRNMIKNGLNEDQINDIDARISLLTAKRIWEIFLHYAIPRILIIAAIDFLLAAIVARNNHMLDKQAKLTNKISEQIEKENQLQSAVIEELASVIETRDTNTGEHVQRTKKYVSIICERLAQEEKYKNILTPTQIRKIVEAAPLHDIGKIAVSDTILLKPGKLTPEEYNQMKIHASKGGEMVAAFFKKFNNDAFASEAYYIAKFHHEKRDGTGYPEGFKGDQIPLEARIMAIADVYDALVSKRVYKASLPPEKAFDILIEESGKHFDPDIIEVLKTIKDEMISAAH